MNSIEEGRSLAEAHHEANLYEFLYAAGVIVEKANTLYQDHGVILEDLYLGSIKLVPAIEPDVTIAGNPYEILFSDEASIYHSGNDRQHPEVSRMKIHESLAKFLDELEDRITRLVQDQPSWGAIWKQYQQERVYDWKVLKTFESVQEQIVLYFNLFQ